MVNIFIIRHGQDEYNAKGILNGKYDTLLTELGKKQAKAVAEKLKHHSIDIIYSSPLKRTFETAQIIARELGVKVIVDNDLIERDYGILTGKTLEEIPKYATKILHGDRVDYFLNGEGVENFSTTYTRAKNILKKLEDIHTKENILLVTHSDIAKMLRAAYHDWTWEEGLRTPYFDNTAIIELALLKDHLE